MMRRNAKKKAEKMQQVTLPHPRELAPFILHAPLSVLVRSCMEWLIDAELLQQLFEPTAQEQYTREITLDFMAYLMLDVACGIEPSAGVAPTHAQRRHATDPADGLARQRQRR